MGQNTQIVFGRLGKDPEVRTTAGGTTVVSCSVVSNEYGGKEDGKAKYIDEWFAVKLFGATADFVAKNMRKGDDVFVQGKRRTEKWVKDGTEQRREVLLADVFQKARGGQASASSNSGSRDDASHGSSNQVDDDEIPF